MHVRKLLHYGQENRNMTVSSGSLRTIAPADLTMRFSPRRNRCLDESCLLIGERGDGGASPEVKDLTARSGLSGRDGVPNCPGELVALVRLSGLWGTSSDTSASRDNMNSAACNTSFVRPLTFFSRKE